MEHKKANWLVVNVTYFKPSGKYYSEVDYLLANDVSFYDRREQLTRLINREFPDSAFTFVSLDSAVLGFPYMKVGELNGTSKY